MAQDSETTRAQVQARTRRKAKPKPRRRASQGPVGVLAPKPRPTGVFAEKPVQQTRLQREVQKGIEKVHPTEHHHNLLQTLLAPVRAVYGHGDNKGKGGGTAAVKPSNPLAQPLGMSAIGKESRAIAAATASDPIGVTTKTAKGLGSLAVGSIAAIPETTAKLVTHPIGTVEDLGKAAGKDYGRRYGGTLEDQIKRIKNEGAAPEVSDAFGLLTSGGAVAGRALGGAARTGALGARAQELATAARPLLKVAGNTARAQDLSPNLFKAAAQRAEDALRAKKAEHVGTAGLNPKAGEVAPLAAHRAQRIEASKLSSRAHIKLKRQQVRELNRGAERNLASLSKQERQGFSHAVKFGIRTPEQARRILVERRRQILANRGKGVTVPTKVDEIPLIDDLLKNADTTFTPRLAAVAAEEAQRTRRLAELDPSFGALAGDVRPWKPLAAHYGVSNAYDDARKTIERRARRGKTNGRMAPTRKEINAAKRELEMARRHEAAARAAANVDVPRVDSKVIASDEAAAGARKEFSAASSELSQANKAWRNSHRNAADLYSDAERARDAARLQAARRRKAQAKLSYDEVKQDLGSRLGRAPTPKLARLEKARARVQAAEKRLASAREAHREFGRESTGTKAQLLDVLEQRRPELERPFQEEMRALARREGLNEPAYFGDRKRPGRQHLSWTVGQGGQAAAGHRRYEGHLTALGVADTSPQAYLDALAKNIRVGTNWKLVADQAERHSVKVSMDQVRAVTRRKGAAPDNLTAEEARGIIDRLPEHEQKNLVVYRPGMRHAEEFVNGRLQQLDKGLSMGSDAADLVRTSGYRILPKPAWDAIVASGAPASLPGRFFDKFQGLQSAALLGTSPAWLQAQVGANAFLTGFGVRGNVADVVNAQRWWHTLSQDQRDFMDEILGQGVAAHMNMGHLGASINESNRLVAGWRAFKSTPFMRRANKANPLDLLFRADDAQNKAFKRAVLYSTAKRKAYAQMGRDFGKAQAAQTKLQHLFRLPPEKVLDSIVNNPHLIEEAAQSALDILGDYSRYTHIERRFLKRGILFYGFLRYALRTAFYTLPVKHPIALALTAQLANLHNDEVRDLLGGPEAPWAYSRIFFDKGGKLQSIDLARINPATNPIIDFTQEGPKSLGNLFSPIVGAVMDQRYGVKGFTGRQFTGHGSGEFGSGEDAESRLRIFVDEIASTLAPYRIAKQVTQSGHRTTDSSLLFSPDYIKYKDPKRQAQADQEMAAKGGAGQILLNQLEPYAPKPDNSRQIVARAQDRAKKNPRKRRRAKPGIQLGGASGATSTTVNLGGGGATASTTVNLGG